MKVGPRAYGYSHNWTFFQVVSRLVQSTLSKNREFCYFHRNLPYRDEEGKRCYLWLEFVNKQGKFKQKAHRSTSNVLYN